MPALTQRRIALPLACFVLGLVMLGGLLAYVMTQSPSSAGGGVGGPFTLTDQNGDAVSDASLRGEPFLVFFGFTHCPDVCPTTLFDASEMLRALGPSAKAKVLFVSVDPQRDTPEVLKSYLGSFDPRIVGLTGSQEAVDAMAKAYRVYARKVPLKDGDYTMDHTALVYLMDRTGRFVGGFDLKRAPAAAAAEYQRYLS
ncbi:SCO family protein [Chelatococcus reniformis]|uniref:Copper-binding protein n=1 Tax=Chelatococcus reniformis TaxID=1494448 RepID=A0A916UY18_9HYPH|nr:SCO family protein [Chelatococcus reniformis]GGC93424.1 copper-binding protein [Chelatococcus reniformis]